MGDPKRGLYRKFDVYRTDGSSAPGRKHEGCRYFVLDLTHDKFARVAVEAYAKACREKYPLLADDLEHAFCSGSPFFDGHPHGEKAVDEIPEHLRQAPGI